MRNLMHGPRLTQCLVAAGLSALAAGLASASPTVATGIVFHDLDADGIRDAHEPGIGGVRVSNGQDIVTTDDRGRYSIEIDAQDDIVFVIKPRGYRTAMDPALHLPRFYYIHKPAGSPDDDFLYPGVEPTGPLPESIDFPLHAQDEPDTFRVLLFGDPQPYSEEQLGYYAREIIDEVRDAHNHDAAFVIVLGDLLGDYLDLYDAYNETNARLGIPIYNVHGNHDLNFKSRSDEHSDETFERVFGPATYAFQYGPVHFVVLDNVRWDGFDGLRDDGFPATGNYQGWLRDDQLLFIENLAATIPSDEQIVLAMHIPFFETGATKHMTTQYRRVLEILSGHPHTASFSAHTHRLWSESLGSDHGYATARGKPHLHFNVGATCGSWWRGPLDADGLPFAIMTDGTPNGYMVATFDGPDYSLRWKVAGKPFDRQMHAHLPDVIRQSDAQGLSFTVNAYMARASEPVQWRLTTGTGHAITPWSDMTHTPGMPDPAYVELYERDRALALSPQGRGLRNPSPCTHLFQATLPSNLAIGSYVLEARFTDMWSQTHATTRPFRVRPDANHRFAD